MGFLNGVDPRQAAHPLLHGDARHVVRRRRRGQRDPGRHRRADHRPADPRPRARALPRPAARGLAGAGGAGASPMSSRTTPGSAATCTRSAAARTWRRSPASPSTGCGSRPSPSPAPSTPWAACWPRPSSGLGNALIGQGRLFTTITAVVVGGTALMGGQGSVLQTLVGVLIVMVLANGMVLMGISALRPAGGAGPDDHRRGGALDRPRAAEDRQVTRPRPGAASTSTSAFPGVQALKIGRASRCGRTRWWAWSARTAPASRR